LREGIAVRTLFIDANNLSHRAHGQAPLEHEGQRTEILFLGLNMVRKYLKDFQPDDVVVVWDFGRDRRRLQLFPNYKNQLKRKKLTPVEERERAAFYDQMNKLEDCLKEIGITQYRCKGREADDVIYNLLMNEAASSEFILISSDKDFFQLFDCMTNIKIYSPIKKKLYEQKDVEEEFGISVQDYVDYKALVGDPSDALPGVKGIGPKWARWLVNNVISGDSIEDGSNFTQSQLNMIDKLFSDLGNFSLMKTLIAFMHIDAEELAEGRTEDIPANTSELHERIMLFCHKYGFAGPGRDFSAYVGPFSHLLLRRGS